MPCLRERPDSTGPAKTALLSSGLGAAPTMNLPIRTTITSAAFMFVAGTALSLPLEAHQARFPALAMVPSRTDDDGGLLFSGNPVVLTGPSNRPTNHAWMRFRTDPCGTLLRVEDRRSVFTQSTFRADDNADDFNGFDEDDPADMARDMIERWLSEHPQVAVINDGIDKGCDDGRLDDENAHDDWGSTQIA